MNNQTQSKPYLGKVLTVHVPETPRLETFRATQPALQTISFPQSSEILKHWFRPTRAVNNFCLFNMIFDGNV